VVVEMEDQLEQLGLDQELKKEYDYTKLGGVEGLKKKDCYMMKKKTGEEELVEKYSRLNYMRDDGDVDCE
jgi:hypothetical protein